MKSLTQGVIYLFAGNVAYAETLHDFAVHFAEAFCWTGDCVLLRQGQSDHRTNRGGPSRKGNGRTLPRLISPTITKSSSEQKRG